MTPRTAPARHRAATAGAITLAALATGAGAAAAVRRRRRRSSRGDATPVPPSAPPAEASDAHACAGDAELVGPATAGRSSGDVVRLRRGLAAGIALLAWAACLAVSVPLAARAVDRPEPTSTSVAPPPVQAPGPTVRAPRPSADPDERAGLPDGAVPSERRDRTAAAAAAATAVAEPVVVRIPRIGVEASVVPLALDGAGALEVPDDFRQAGWYEQGPEPGELGNAVVVGHVDSYRGPAVFFRLRDLVAGDVVDVARADGSSASFVVTAATVAPKDAFPTDLVYGPSDRPVLQLVTCHGAFRDGHYVDNLIVTAELLEEVTAAPQVG